MTRNQITAAKKLMCSFIFPFMMTFSTVLSYGFEIQSAVCGHYHLAYFNFSGHDVFYINGREVEKELICEVVILNYGNCVKSYIANTICMSDPSTVKPSYDPRRKLLLDRYEEGPLPQQVGPQNRKYVFPAPVIGMAIPGLILLGCVFLSPCLQPTRKENEETLVPNSQASILSSSSLDRSTNPEQIPRTPSRYALARSLRNAPPSPFHHAPPTPRASAATNLARWDTIHLNYKDIVKATQNFSPSLIIGDGHSATVYKGRLHNDQEVAVKRTKMVVFDSAEFDSEVQILSKIDHRNLVKLLGYVDEGNERIIVTEYVPNGTLRQHLDGKRGKTLDFNQRLEVAIDIAHGLTYLHLYGENQIIHRNVKSSNILLTERLRAKVADFGFAKVGSGTGDCTDISTKVQGTFGYLDPEYIRTYKLNPKSDVFSYGILLLEILTGRRPVEPKRPYKERVLLRWVSNSYSMGNVVEVVDPQMNEATHPHILKKLVWLGIQCAGPIREERPEMKVVGMQLLAIRKDYLKHAKRESIEL